MVITDRLVADIGGTNARFAMLDEHDRPHEPTTLPCDDFANLPAALEHYLASQLGSRAASRPTQVALAVATPVSGDQVTLTNRPNWSFSQQELKRSFDLSSLTVLNCPYRTSLAMMYRSLARH